jgi:hypothetical protein
MAVRACRFRRLFRSLDGRWKAGTIELIAAAVRAPTREVAYEVPAQGLRVDLRTRSTAPRSGLVLPHVRAA